jgi:hypothetical protein
MPTHRAGSEWQHLEGIVINLFQSGYFERKIWAIIPIGGGRIDLLHIVLKNGIDTLHTHRPPHISAHAIHDSDLDAIKANA